MKNYCLITQLMDEFVNKPAIFNITPLNQVTVGNCDLGQISRGWSSFVEYNQVLRSVTGGVLICDALSAASIWFGSW